ncbi:hypothetical protein ACMAZF_17390 [Psychrobium sp. nBUS_13]|uniref:hypothetical protein n=1 Tax=Psychrobium sp. nBUS_13 TaxID=3395319 RepID=UPI003EBAE0CA
MNFGLLNPYGAYHTQQTQAAKSTSSVESQPSGNDLLPPAQVDTVTLSPQAIAGESVKKADENTYEHLAVMQNIKLREAVAVEQADSTTRNDPLAHIDTSNFLADAMASIVEGRLGVDKEKVKEIEAMIEEVAKDESLSAQEKEKRIGELQELLEKEYEKAAEKQANQKI